MKLLETWASTRAINCAAGFWVGSGKEPIALKLLTSRYRDNNLYDLKELSYPNTWKCIRIARDITIANFYKV